MAGWMSNGTKGVKSRWVTIVVDRNQLHKLSIKHGVTLCEMVDELDGRIYGE